MKAFRSAILATVALFASNASPATASDANGYYFAHGALTCAEFTTARQATRRLSGPTPDEALVASMGASFIGGWLTAYDDLVPDTFDLIPAGVEAAEYWVENYCRANPSDQLPAALHKLAEEAYPNRVRTKSR